MATGITKDGQEALALVSAIKGSVVLWSIAIAVVVNRG